MTTGCSGTPPTIEDPLAALRARLAATPRDVDALVELSDALVQRVATDPTRAPVAGDTDEPIELLRSATELAADADPRLQATILAGLGHLLAWRLRILLDEESTPQDKLQQQVDEAIRCHRRALDSAAEAGGIEEFISVELTAVLELVDLLRLRCSILGDIGDLSAAIEYQKQVLGVLDSDDEIRPEVLYQLGLDYAIRSDQHTKSMRQDQECAIACLREVRALIGDDHPGRPELAIRLGIMLGYRVLESFAESSDKVVAEAIAELTIARQVPATEGEAADAALVRFRLGMLHAFCYLNRGGDTENLKIALAELDELADQPDTTPEQADGCHLISAMLECSGTAPVELRRGWELFAKEGQERLQEMFAAYANAASAEDTDAKQAVRRHLDALSESLCADPELSTLVRGLRAATLTSSDVQGNGLNATNLHDAAAWIDEMAPEFATTGIAKEVAVIQAGMRAALAHKSGDRAVGATAAGELTEALAALDENHPLRTLVHGMLGFLVDTVEPADSVDQASAVIAATERILAEFPDDHPDRARLLTKASASLFSCTAVNRSVVSFDRIREILTQATEPAAADDVNNAVNYFLLGGLNGFQGTIDHDITMINSGIELMKKAINIVPKDHQLQNMIGPSLGALLYGRAFLSGDLDNYAAAELYSRYTGSPVVEDEHEPSDRDREMQGMGAYLAAGAKLARNRNNLDAALIDEAIEKMTAATEQFPADSFLHQHVSSNIEALQVVRDLHDLTPQDSNPASTGYERLTAGVDMLLAKLRDTPEGHLVHASDTNFAAMAMVSQGFLARDPDSLDRAISMLSRLCSRSEISVHERLNALGSLAASLRMRYGLFRRRRDLNNAIDRFEQAEILIQHSPPSSTEIASILHLLADSYHERADPHRRDRERAVETALRGLRERAKGVLLQNDSESALHTAIAASGETADVARWCLAAGRTEAAVHALELGRAIVLHFVTVDAGIPTLLREGGYADLAAEWEQEPDRTSNMASLPWNLDQYATNQERYVHAATELMANLSTVAVPGDLRHRVLDAIKETETYARLLDSPAITDITAALAATGSAALVYLLPADGLHQGLAVIVQADGTVHTRTALRHRHRLRRVSPGAARFPGRGAGLRRAGKRQAALAVATARPLRLGLDLGHGRGAVRTRPARSTAAGAADPGSGR
jgi:tetratricopeptide (TPR) repeat protein